MVDEPQHPPEHAPDALPPDAAEAPDRALDAVGDDALETRDRSAQTSETWDDDGDNRADITDVAPEPPEADSATTVEAEVAAHAAHAEDATEAWEDVWDTDTSATTDADRPSPSQSTASDNATAIPPVEDGDRAAGDEWDMDLGEWVEPLPPAPPSAKAPIETSWQDRLRALWQQVLAGLRRRLPAIAPWSDGVLSVGIIGILVLLLVLGSVVSRPAPAAIAPPSPNSDVAAPIPDADLATEAPAPSEFTEPAEPTVSDADRDRITAIQTQLAEISDRYASGLVQFVQADFAHNQLTVNLSPEWYRLSDTAQDDLTTDLWTRTQGLSFAKLLLQDPEGNVVARSPVIGDAMIVLQRQRPPIVPEPERPRYRLTIDR